MVQIIFGVTDYRTIPAGLSISVANTILVMAAHIIALVLEGILTFVVFATSMEIDQVWREQARAL